MKNKFRYKFLSLVIAMGLTAACFTGCGTASASTSGQNASDTAVQSTVESTETSGSESNSAAVVSTANVTSSGIFDASDAFTERDLTQTADLSNAVTYTVADGEDIHIDKEGVYVLTGTASNVTVYVEADDTAKVQLVLDGLNITNSDFPCIYVKSADKVFVTSTGENVLSCTGTFTADGDTNTDAVIFSKDDLVLNGTGTLTITSTDNGVSCKDDLKATGGTYVINASSKAIEANDSILISDGAFKLTSGADAIHAENEEDGTLGYIYICGGDFAIDSGDDGIHGTAFVQIDDGTFEISGAEAIEATYVQINGGDIDIESWDDGINATTKSTAYTVCVEITGGDIKIAMGQGDTDGVDSNGNLIITGGTIDVTGQSAFDCDGSIVFTGGTVIVNGQEVENIQSQMMGGGHGGMGSPGGMNGNGGMGGPGRRG